MESTCSCETKRTESVLFLLMQRANIGHQRVNLFLAKRILERRHSALAIGNDLSEFGIRQLFDRRQAKIWNVHALADLRTASVWTVAHSAFRTERRTACCAVRTGVSPHNGDHKKRESNKEHKQN